jgi:putative aldouronate transport system permease protein
VLALDGAVKRAPRIHSWRLRLGKNIKRDKALIALVFLPVVYFAIFHYGPMYGILIAFKRYSPGRGIWGSTWVGLRYFEEFFRSIYAWRLIRNVLLINIYQLLFSFPIPIIFALLLNEVRNRKFKRVVQTISYMPHFVSVVVVVSMLFIFLSMNNGVVNNFLRLMGREAVGFMTSVPWFRTLYIGSNIWQSFGWSSIIYLAAISGIDQEQYEAVRIDGANRLQQIWYITIPNIMPTIIILFILQFGRMMSVGYEKIILMYSPAIYEVSDVISTYVYRVGILNGEYGFATAVGLFNNVVNFILLISINMFSRKVSETSLW